MALLGAQVLCGIILQYDITSTRMLLYKASLITKLDINGERNVFLLQEEIPGKSPTRFGFINYEVGDSKKLFFHVKEVQDGVELQAGDEVEFSVILNQRTGKCSACNVWRVCNSTSRAQMSCSIPCPTSASSRNPDLPVAVTPAECRDNHISLPYLLTADNLICPQEWQ
ncbi:hypothetical protein PANDA_000327 [Ailuropoda melanoleuca]|uniref:CSD domain-containing protein n=1 Tax=Ailuropoda melanoleuca TaxID=9646 RepID=D2GUK0_AILME|nr:hypothetical protein PANDA_000327 [Ailuropoda melanoleuca]